jgi:hypothetical protein
MKMCHVVKCLRRIIFFSKVCGIIPLNRLSATCKMSTSKTLAWIFVATKALLMAYFAFEFYSQSMSGSQLMVDDALW